MDKKQAAVHATIAIIDAKVYDIMTVVPENFEEGSEKICLWATLRDSARKELNLTYSEFLKAKIRFFKITEIDVTG